MCVRLWVAAGERRRRRREQIEVAGLFPAPPVHPIHHCGSALFSCSSTSREGWEAPILSWQPSAVHSQSHIITTFIFISIDTRPFPPLKLNQRGCRKGGREGTMEREKEGELMMKCRPRPQLIAFQFACKWFSVRAGAISWGVNWGRGWETTLIYCPGTQHCRLPWVTKMAAGIIHKSTQKIIPCIYKITLCTESTRVNSFTVINDSIPISGSISTGSWYCWSCTVELWWPDREEDRLD